MKNFVVIKNMTDEFEILYCGTNEEIAEEKLYQGERANVIMEIWDDGKQVDVKFGNLKRLQSR